MGSSIAVASSGAIELTSTGSASSSSTARLSVTTSRRTGRLASSFTASPMNKPRLAATTASSRAPSSASTRTAAWMVAPVLIMLFKTMAGRPRSAGPGGHSRRTGRPRSRGRRRRTAARRARAGGRRGGRRPADRWDALQTSSRAPRPRSVVARHARNAPRARSVRRQAHETIDANPGLALPPMVRRLTTTPTLARPAAPPRVGAGRPGGR
jgi:hypothetical protein